jgi:hypothetical protein
MGRMRGRLLVGIFRLDQAVVAVFAAEHDGELVGLLVVEDDEGTVAKFEVHDGFVGEEGADFVLLGVDVGGLDVVFLGGVEDFGVEDLLFDVADAAVFARAVALEEAGLVLPHAPGDLGDGFVDGGVDVLRGALHFDDDVIGTEEDDFGDLAVLLDVEDNFGLDDARVVEVEALDFLVGVIADGLGDIDVASCDDDGQVNVVLLHGGVLLGWGVMGWESWMCGGYMVKSSPR